MHSLDQVVPQTSRATTFRWTICALLFAATTINYIDRQILSLLKPLLDQELGWTNQQFGIANSLFQGAYALSLLIFGWLIDRYGTKIGYALSILAWSLAAAGHAFASTVAGFYAWRVALGLGEGGNFPAAIKATALWFPKSERAFATTLFNSGANIGALIAPATIPFLATAIGWHLTFVVAGAVGLIWITAWWALFSLPSESKYVNKLEFAHIESDGDQEQTQKPIPWRNLLSYRGAWAFIVVRLMTDPVWWFFLIWLPDYFHKVHGQDLKQSSGKLVALYGIVTVLSIFAGWLSAKLAKSGWSINKVRKVSQLVSAGLVVPIVFVPTFSNPWVAVMLIGLAGGAHQAWSATNFTTVSDMFPRSAVASLTGIGGMVGALGGMLFPVATGQLLDHYKALGNLSSGYGVLFTGCAFAYLAALVVNHLLAPRFDPVKIKEA